MHKFLIELERDHLYTEYVQNCGYNQEQDEINYD